MAWWPSYSRHRSRTGSTARPSRRAWKESRSAQASSFSPAGLADFYRRDDISYMPLQDVAARMVALAYHKHRAMPELGQFAELVTSMLGSKPDQELTG